MDKSYLVVLSLFKLKLKFVINNVTMSMKYKVFDQLWLSDKWVIYIFTTSIQRLQVVGWGLSGFGVDFLLYLLMAVVCLWLSCGNVQVLAVNCHWMLLVCWVSGVGCLVLGVRCCLLIVCVGYCSIFLWQWPPLFIPILLFLHPLKTFEGLNITKLHSCLPRQNF